MAAAGVEVAVVIGWEEGPRGARPAFITRPEEADRLVFDGRCVQNLATYLNPRRTNIAAKGLTGLGYEGHYFWDTEVYILPFFLYTQPETSRKLLEYRYYILDKARQRVRDLVAKAKPYPLDPALEKEMNGYCAMVAARGIEEFYGYEQEDRQDWDTL